MSSMRIETSFHWPSYLYLVRSLLNSTLYQSITSLVALVSPQAMYWLKPDITLSAPGIVAPEALCFGELSCITNQIEGRLSPRCGSFASIGFPVADFAPETAQLLLPLSGCGFEIVSVIVSNTALLFGNGV